MERPVRQEQPAWEALDSVVPAWQGPAEAMPEAEGPVSREALQHKATRPAERREAQGVGADKVEVTRAAELEHLDF